jgi:hypothetical protein
MRSCAAAAVSLFFLVSCGRAVSDAKNYAPNAAPEIGAFSAVNSDGTTVDASKIAVNRVYRLTVGATDPESQGLRYTFRSAFGTFRDQTPTQTGCTVNFVVGVVKANDTVSVAVDVRDPRSAVTSKSLDIGTGKLGPSISVVPVPGAIQSDGTSSLSVTSNCAGSFQFQPMAADTDAGTPPSWNPGIYVMSYPSGSGSVPAVLAGPNSSTDMSIAQLGAAGSYSNTTCYNVWVLFRDVLNQVDAVPVKVRADDEEPQIYSNTASASSGSISTAPSIDITFNEEMDPDSFSSASLAVTPTIATAANGTPAFRMYVAETRTAVFEVSGLSQNTEYSAALTGVKDLAGNGISALKNSFVFVTTPGCSLSYSGNGQTSGDAPAPANYTNGTPVTVAEQPSNLAKTGCFFGGWNTRADGTGVDYAAGSTFTMGTESVTLYAKWMCRVTFDKNSGSASAGNEPAEVLYNTPVQKPDNPSLGICEFMGWYTASDGGTEWDFNNPVTSTMTLYAHWGFSITVNPNNGTSSYFVTVVSGEQYTPDPPLCPGFKFGDWYTDPAFGSAYDGTVNVNMTALYAKWTYTITLNSNFSGATVTGGITAADFVLQTDKTYKMTAVKDVSVTLPDRSTCTWCYCNGGAYYGFTGSWFTAADMSTAALSSYSSASGNVTLYAGHSIGLAVGDRGPAGGWIFYKADTVQYDSGGPWQYLEAATSDIQCPIDPNEPWIASSWLFEFVNGSTALPTTLGQGKENSSAILSKDPSTSSAAKCHVTIDHWSDWFLPSLDEIKPMYENLYKNNIGSFFTNGTYVSSSEPNETWYYGLVMGASVCATNGYQKTGTSGYRIRPVRRFY